MSPPRAPEAKAARALRRLRAMKPDSSLPHASTAQAALAALGAGQDRGLEQDEAARRLVRDGPNRLATTKRRSKLRAFVDQLANPLVLTLLAAAAIATTVGFASS